MLLWDIAMVLKILLKYSFPQNDSTPVYLFSFFVKYIWIFLGGFFFSFFPPFLYSKWIRLL